MGLAERVREGGEAEARRAVEMKPLSQIAIVRSLRGLGLGRVDFWDA